MIDSLGARGFPAMSADGSKIVVFDQKHPMDSATSVLVMDVRNKTTLREIPLLRDEEGTAVSDTSKMSALFERAWEVERMIESDSFRPMAPLYTLPGTGQAPVEQVIGAGRWIRFDRRSGRFG